MIMTIFCKHKAAIITAVCALLSLALPFSSHAQKQSKTLPKVKSTPAPPIRGAALITPATRNNTRSQYTLVLADNKKALLPIVISEKASDSTRMVAAELAEYLGRMSGAKFEVTTGDGSRGIVLGTISEFPTPALNEALKIVNGFDGREAYAIRTRDKRLLLLGATDLGASHAAYRLLHELGCRWFFPHPAWEVIPTVPKIQFNREITDRPTILSRNICFEVLIRIPQ